ncbi:hypothetical protein ADT25_09230 [Xanthomonas oryzae]|uniref:Uncharacterized protein n=1 Tax=Xanthomonas oryzae TaxID=347 RepID=A0AAP0ZLD6_9XANT|nr:hypothetical protein ADT25_09230 [Xanthomonas oryzae]
MARLCIWRLLLEQHRQIRFLVFGKSLPAVQRVNVAEYILGARLISGLQHRFAFGHQHKMVWVVVHQCHHLDPVAHVALVVQVGVILYEARGETLRGIIPVLLGLGDQRPGMSSQGERFRQGAAAKHLCGLLP